MSYRPWIWAGRGRFEWRDGWRARVQLYVWPLPRVIGEQAFQPPAGRFRGLDGRVDPDYTLATGGLTVRIDLLNRAGAWNPRVSWTCRGGDTRHGDTRQVDFRATLFDDDRFRDYVKATLSSDANAPRSRISDVFREKFEVTGRLVLRPDPAREAAESREVFPLPSAGHPALGT